MSSKETEFEEKKPLIIGDKGDSSSKEYTENFVESSIDWKSVKYYPFARYIHNNKKTRKFKENCFEIVERETDHPTLVMMYLKRVRKEKTKFQKGCLIFLFVVLMFVPIVNIIVIVIVLYLYISKFMNFQFEYSIMIHDKSNVEYWKGMFYIEDPKKKFEFVRNILKYDKKGVLNYFTCYDLFKMNMHIVKIQWKASMKNVELFMEEINKE